MTHPCAHLGGLLRGALSITVSDTCYITCAKTQTKAILQYLEESWIGRAQYKVEGVIFRYDPNNDTTARIKDVPEKNILARISGSWHGKIYFTPTGSKEPRLLIDLTPLYPIPKKLPPEEYQLPNESRKFWSGVTSAILDKRYSEATKLKHDIEERQRSKQAERNQKQITWQPRFFTGAVTPSGKPELTEEGFQVLHKLHENEYKLDESEVSGA